MQQRPDMDWVLKGLADSLRQTRQVVLLSQDGLKMAQYGGDQDTADRLAAACSGLHSLATAVGKEFPGGNGNMRNVGIEVSGGFFCLMAAGSGTYLGVLADEGVDTALMMRSMRDLVARIGEHLSTPMRTLDNTA